VRAARTRDAVRRQRLLRGLAARARDAVRSRRLLRGLAARARDAVPSRRLLRGLAALGGVVLAACTQAPAPSTPGAITEVERERALREAEAWRPVDTASLDVRAGPPGTPDAGTPVDCTFVVPATSPSGRTPKFLCRTAEGRVLKVKYGPENMEVHAEVFGSRLLWLLGFHTDRVDPVRLRCRGCPEDPWHFLQGLDPADPRPDPPTSRVHEFPTAAVETHLGRPIEARPGQGLPWPAILSQLSPNPERAHTQRVHREALTLLAAFLGHGDSKPGNQTLACLPDGGPPDRCRRPVVYVGDLGSILGHGSGLLRVSKVDVEDWVAAPVWRDPSSCVTRFRTHRLGTLFDTPVSEPARAFLAERLAALGDDQIRALFDVAGLDGVGGEIEDPDGTAHPPTLDDWLRAFRAKRRQITEHRCPEPGAAG